MPYVIAAPCVDVQDLSCVEECPVDCIYEGPRSTYINQTECIDCGACQLACPVSAIFYAPDVPDKWFGHIAASEEVFDVLGTPSPGGARKIGRLPADARLVNEMEPSNG